MPARITPIHRHGDVVLLQHHRRHHLAQPADRHHELQHQQRPRGEHQRLEVPEDNGTLKKLF